MILDPGKRIGRYTIEELLGEGAMGRVYRARDHQLERSVALKLLRIDESASPEERERGGVRLVREARAAAALDHANAIVIHDVGELEGYPFLAMELVEGASLRSYVGDPSVPAATRIRWLVDVAQALAAAHARGLIHRDVKPENVMLRRRDGVIKVLDFGIARRTSPHGPAATATAHAHAHAQSTLAPDTATLDGYIAGTPRYMAPEQIRGERLDARADQFAWGVLAYELLVGRPPFQGAAASFTLIAAITSDEPVELEPLVEACGDEAYAVFVIERALSKRRDARFESMDELLAALKPAPITLPAPAPVKRGGKLRKALLGAAAFAVLSGAGLGAKRLRERPAVTLGVNVRARMTDFAPTSTQSAEAKAAYVEGLTLLREASSVPGVRALLRAVKADPDIIEARVRLLAFGRKLGEVDEREHFEKAWAQRTKLTERDRALLEALSPLYLAVPPDEEESKRRLDALAARFPLDAELGYLAAARDGSPARLVSRLAAVLELDPEFSLALWLKSVTELTAGDYESALRSLDQCVRATPSSTACLSVRVLIEEEVGQCEAMDRDARVLEARSPSARTHDWVARVLLARGAPIDSIRATLERKWASASEGERTSFRLTDEGHLAIAEGDFETAEARALALASLVDPSSDEEGHKTVAWALVDLYTEMGDTARAAKVADQYLKARSAWQSIGPWAMLPVFYAAAARGGLRSEDEVRAGRDAWMKSWDAEPGYFRSQAWLFGYAEPARSEAEAKEALAVAPPVLPRAHGNQFNRMGIGSAGRVLLLAGRAAEALPHLRRAAATCSLLPAPIAQTQAQLYFGEALEANGAKTEACAAYDVVLQRWGQAKPRSVTAEQARERETALRCRL